MRRAYLPTLLILILLGAACARLPADFDDLDLKEQIVAYEQYLERGGLGHDHPNAMISLQGVPAANAMVPYLRGDKTQIPVSEALDIVLLIAARGCELRGTEVHSIVRAIVDDPLRPEDIRSEARDILQVIESGASAPELLDEYGKGACVDHHGDHIPK